MILPGSYANGFAPRDGRPLYPQLWRGCVGAWAPCLGPTGLILREWSGRCAHGTLISGPTWQASSGRHAVLFDGVDDYVATTASISGLQRITVSFWAKPNSTSTSVEVTQTTDSTTRAGFTLTGDGSAYCIPNNIGGGANGGFVFTNWSSLGARWIHYAATFDGTQSTVTNRIRIHLDGISRSLMYSGFFDPTVTGTYSGLLTFGRRNIASETWSAGQIDDVRVYSRILSPQEIGILASRRGISYELAPRRRSSSAVQFNRRRRLLVGAGS